MADNSSNRPKKSSSDSFNCVDVFVEASGNPTTLRPHSSGQASTDSLNCVDIYVDEPGDNTVRPGRPSLAEHTKAQQAIIAEALAAREAAAAKIEKTD